MTVTKPLFCYLIFAALACVPVLLFFYIHFNSSKNCLANGYQDYSTIPPGQCFQYRE